MSPAWRAEPNDCLISFHGERDSGKNLIFYLFWQTLDFLIFLSFLGAYEAILDNIEGKQLHFWR